MQGNTRLGGRPIGVSVVVNTLNRAESLKRTLEGLHRQRYREFEIVVVNGPSSDGTDTLLRTCGTTIRIARCPDANIGRSRNIGIEVASGDVVAFIDDDAVPGPTWVERLASAYHQPSVAAAGGWVFNAPLGRMEFCNCTCTRSGNISMDAKLPASTCAVAGADPFLYLTGCNMSFRRSVLTEVGLFNEAYVFGYEDVDMCRRILDAGHMIVQLGEEAVVYHHPAPNCFRDPDGAIRDIYPLLRARVMFALEGVADEGRHQDVISSLNQFAEFWRNSSRKELADGTRTAEEHATFVRRIDDALRDGLAASKQSRSRRALHLSQAQSFRRYPLRDDEASGANDKRSASLAFSHQSATKRSSGNRFFRLWR